MSRYQWLAAAAAVLIASPALAQSAPAQSEAKNASSARQDFEAIAPVTTVSPEQLELTATLTVDDEYAPPRHAWQPASASRLQRGRDLGASSGRVIRACEINLALGDEDCAAP